MVPVDATAVRRRLAILRSLRRRWVAEYPEILASDSERALHHREAIADLDKLIEQVEAICSPQLDVGLSASDSEDSDV